MKEAFKGKKIPNWCLMKCPIPPYMYSWDTGLKVQGVLYTPTKCPDSHPIWWIPVFKVERRESCEPSSQHMLTSPAHLPWQLSKSDPQPDPAHRPNAVCRIRGEDGKPGTAPGRNRFGREHKCANEAAFQLPSFWFNQLSHGFHFECWETL